VIAKNGSRGAGSPALVRQTVLIPAWDQDEQRSQDGNGGHNNERYAKQAITRARCGREGALRGVPPRTVGDRGCGGFHLIEENDAD